MTMPSVQDIALEDATPPKPFIKWVGGKRSILPKLHDNLPPFITRYYEPFLGGGALFFSLRANKTRLTNVSLSDVNMNLVMTYNAVKDSLEQVIEELRVLQDSHCKSQFLDIRSRFSEHKPRYEQAAHMIYLNKTCFNGLYRVNKSGGFNVPLGSYENPKILDESKLRAASAALQGCDISYRSALETPIHEDAFYYFDPPYHKTFSSYDSGGFTEDHHRQLRKLCGDIHSAGGKFLLSNSDTPFVQELYGEFDPKPVMAGRAVSCKSDGRGKTQELLIRNY